MSDTEARKDTDETGDGAIACPICQQPFTPTSEQRWCSEPCRVAAWRRRQVAAPARVRPARPAPVLRVYLCAGCGARTTGPAWCPTCRSPMRRLGLGGPCPHCEQPVAVTELLGEEVVPGS